LNPKRPSQQVPGESAGTIELSQRASPRGPAGQRCKKSPSLTFKRSVGDFWVEFFYFLFFSR
jgi:hypothetical protein